MNIFKFLKISFLFFLSIFLSHCTSEHKPQESSTLHTPDTAVVDTSRTDTSHKTKKEPKVIPPLEFTKDRYFNDIARFLAGMPPLDSSAFISWDTLGFVQTHKTTFDKQFSAKENNQLAQLRKWAKKAEGNFYASEGNVFYPFSGADFLTIYNLYPNAKNYILFGLEPEGFIPDFKNLTEEEHDSSLANLSKSIINLMSASFFITNDMAPDLIRTAYKGILPVLLVFVARTGHEVLDIQHVRLNKEGKIEKTKPLAVEKQTPWDHNITGIRVIYRKNKNAEPQSVTYFSLNASTQALKKMEEFTTLIENYGPVRTYIKAASYLMHDDEFSTMRSLILDHSNFLVEDDSGIPYRYFDPKIWDIRLYGRYTKPIRVFKNRFQQDYFDAYKDNEASIEVLKFGIGYVYTLGRSNLITAEKINPE